MNKSTYVYVTFIRTTPEKLWAALTDRETMQQYWFGAYQESDFKPGSPWRLLYNDGRVTDVGTVLECDPPRRLVLHWHNEFHAPYKAEGPSRCTITLEPAKPGVVKLTVLHEMEREHAEFIEKGVAGGWPRILSNLKSLLETGEVIMPEW